MDTLTIRQAFDALVFFLEGEYQLAKSDYILDMLSYLMPSDDRTADPAYWGDWMRAVEKAVWPDTSEKQQMLQELISDQRNLAGVDQYGNEWYARILPDGRQVFADVRQGKIRYAGIRQIPKTFQPGLGFSTPGSP